MNQPEWVKIVWAEWNRNLDDQVNEVIARETGNYETAEVVSVQLVAAPRDDDELDMWVLVRFRGTLVTDPAS